MRKKDVVNSGGKFDIQIFETFYCARLSRMFQLFLQRAAFVK